MLAACIPPPPRDAGVAALDDAGVADAGPPVACADVAQADCAGTPGCEPAIGWAEADFCDGGTSGSEYVGCMVDEDGCGDAITCVVRASDGARVVFPNTCVPPELERCAPCP